MTDRARGHAIGAAAARAIEVSVGDTRETLNPELRFDTPAFLAALAREGYAMVTVEPTEAMVDAGADAYHDACREYRAAKIAAYTALGETPSEVSMKAPPGAWLAPVFRAMINAAKEQDHE